MKPVWVVGFLTSVVIAFVLGRVSQQNAASAQGRGAEEPCANDSSDANGDGTTNLTDAVYILNSLFLGGPAPVPLCPCDGAKGLPATRQAKCYDREAEIPCDSADYPGQDGLYQAGCPGEGRFVDNGDGTVTDNCTGLMWQKDTADVSGNGSVGEEDRLMWQHALKYCYGLSFAGHDDWRLPNVRELQSIVDYGRFDPAIDPVFRAVSSLYRSSSTLALQQALAWGIYFGSGVDDGTSKGGRGYIRAVRGGLQTHFVQAVRKIQPGE